MLSRFALKLQGSLQVTARLMAGTPKVLFHEYFD